MGDTALNAWMTVKTVTFADSATELTVCGYDLNPDFWCPARDFTVCAGFVLSCSGGRWDGVKTDTLSRTWLVTARGLAGADLTPDAANSDSYAVASTSAFTWTDAGQKIWSAVDDEAACFTKVISVTTKPTPEPTPAPTYLPNDWWVTHFAEGKILSGHNKVPPDGYEPIDGAGRCRCQGSGKNLDSCGDTVGGDPAAGEGTLCCHGSPYTNPDPGAAGVTSGANRYYIGDGSNGKMCYKPIGSEYAPDNGNNNNGNAASLAIIIPVVVAAVLLVAAILFLVHKRVVAARQHRRESMPTVGGEGEVQAEA